MKKILYSFVAAALALVSCAPVEFKYEPANEDVSFPSTTGAFTLEGQKLEVPVVRGVADEPLALGVTLIDPFGTYTLDTPVVNFAAGEFEKNVVLSYDLAAMAPGNNYKFTLTFDEKVMSAVGANHFSASAMMPLVYEPYGEVSLIQCSFSRYFTSGNKTYKLNKAKFTTNYYQVENLYNGGGNLEFMVNGESFELLNSINKSTGLVHIPTDANHPSYGSMTCRVDPDPDYCGIDGAGPNDSLVEGSVVFFDTQWAVSAGTFSWTTDALQVTKVN